MAERSHIMKRFHIWTIGCQMNKADSERLAEKLQQLGLKQVHKAEDAGIIVLNSCVVRQSAEDKVANKLSNLTALKKKQPGTILALMGCMVDADTQALKNRFPQVDFFLRPQEFDELLKHVEGNLIIAEAKAPPVSSQSPTAFVPIIQGCDNFCTYCIVPYRRGREKSRPFDDIVCEVQGLAQNGTIEVTLLGQNVDSYGHDLENKPDLADLLAEMNRIDGLARVRFLTSHPKDMSQKLIDTIASLGKVCEHISLPAQSGDNGILKAMRRGYTIEQYKDLIFRIRSAIPDVALSNDIIVGFPGETSEQFGRTLDLLEEFRFDTVHVAAYSPRSGTIAAREMSDNVTTEEKQKRLQLIENLQERIAIERNAQFLGQTVEVLVEGRKNNKWQSRTRSDKLVFFSSSYECLGKLIQVRIDHTGPWSFQGTPVMEQLQVA